MKQSYIIGSLYLFLWTTSFHLCSSQSNGPYWRIGYHRGTSAPRKGGLVSTVSFSKPSHRWSIRPSPIYHRPNVKKPSSGTARINDVNQPALWKVNYNNDNNLRRNSLVQQTAPDKSGQVSLVFVVDSTGSMGYEIKQVKNGIKAIFDTITKNPQCSIHDFILTLFNDPLVGPVLVTTKPEKFIQQLEDIKVGGGKDCNERSLKGIQLAIAHSQPKSYIFVFTDAGAKDYNLVPEIETLIQQKQSQMVFVLTGTCGNIDAPEHQAYERIAAMSFGKVFNLWKNEVHEVLDYVKYTTCEKNRINIMQDDIIRPGRKNYTVPVDSQLNSLTISVSGKHPIIHVEDPHHHPVNGKPWLHVHTALVINVPHPDHGNWSVNVGSFSGYHIHMSGTSRFSFDYSFTTTSSEVTTLQPEIGTETTLLVMVTDQHLLHNLTKVYLKDYHQKVITKLDLHPDGNKPNLYRTAMFIPPSTPFYIEVHGVDRKGFPLERLSQTAVIPKEKPPVVYTLPSVVLYSGIRQEVWCTDLGKTVSWKKHFKTGYQPLDDPRFSVSTNGSLVIDPVTKEDAGWYQCIAQTEAGRVEKHVNVEVREMINLQVTVTPKKTYFVDGENINISCTAQGADTLTLEWMKNKKLIEPSDPRLSVPVKNSLNLHLARTNESDAGRYECTAKSGTKEATDAAELVHVQPPTVNRTATNTISSEENVSLVLNCSIYGKPKPTVTWQKDGRKIKPNDIYKILPNGQLLIATVKMSSSGAYTCIGQNSIGQAQQTINLEVGSPPEFKIQPQDIDIPIETNGSIPCDVAGSPKPKIIWERLDGLELDEDRIVIGNSCTLTITDARYEDQGGYIVTAENSFGIIEIPITVSISGIEPPTFEHEYYGSTLREGDTAVLQCNPTGKPSPHIKWLEKGSLIEGQTENTLVLNNVQEEASGIYNCHASNIAGNATKTFQLIVIPDVPAV